MSQEILRIENLIKTYRSEWSFKKIHALDINELIVNEGEAYGYLGENGAGKTTTIKCILNFIKKDKCKIYFRGSELKDNKQNNLIGYLPE
ncbi:MAG: ATP-binding cassette domain-containing protein, partial [Proteobacteria bacterium]|nr:ATP-binding cassette domain-containing protein [Pseudomonadota bacterium]